MKTFLSLAALCVVLVSFDAFAEEEHEAPLSKIVLTDGQELHARVIEQTDEKVVLELTSGGRMELPASSVRSIR